MRLSDWSSDVCSSDLDGMAMDAEADIRAPAMADFRLYCRRVAGAVGVLSVHAFGATEPEAHELALAEGAALQFPNILRDLAEAAARGRLYLPRRSEEHTSELQSLIRISYPVVFLKKTK